MAENTHASLSLPHKVLEHVRVSDAYVQKTAAERAERQQVQTAVDSLIPQVCDTLVKHARVKPEEREKLAGMLKNPVKALEILMKVAGHRNADELAKLGQPVGANGQTKQASAGSSRGGMEEFVTGARKTGDSPADTRLFGAFGIAVQ